MAQEITEYKIHLPSDMSESVSEKEVIGLLMNKAYTKAEYYLSKGREFEEKYKTDFLNFQRNLENQKEDYKKWDDLILWEGFRTSYLEWNKKYEELKACLK